MKFKAASRETVVKRLRKRIELQEESSKRQRSFWMKCFTILNRTDWQLSLQNLPALFDSLDTIRRTDETGVSYEDYLQVFLFSCSKAKKIDGGMDLSKRKWEI